MVILLAGAGLGSGQDVDLSGRVQHLDKPGLSLEKRIAAAEQEFLKEHKEGLYLTGYVFPSRNGVNMPKYMLESRHILFRKRRSREGIHIRH